MKQSILFPKDFGIAPYIFLIYLIMPFFHILDESGVKAVVGYVLLLLFLVVYLRLYQNISDRQYFILLGCQFTIVAIYTLFYNPFNLLLGFYTSSFLGWVKNKRNFYIGTGVYSVLLIIISIPVLITMSSRELIFFIPFIFVMLISPYGMRSMSEKMELEKQLDQANEKIKMLIKQEERVRIARDLHDTLGHTLSLITFQSQLVQKMIEKNPEKALQEAKGIEQTSRAALQQVRELVADMRVITVEEELLHIAQLFRKAGIEFTSKGQEALPPLPPLQQTIIGMCLREASTNVVKHSKATVCEVSLQASNREVLISVADNGIGVRKTMERGSGLKGMAERLSLIEGTMSLTSDSGATLTISVPIIASKVEGVEVG